MKTTGTIHRAGQNFISATTWTFRLYQD